jgi:hypothetical protein
MIIPAMIIASFVLIAAVDKIITIIAHKDNLYCYGKLARVVI